LADVEMWNREGAFCESAVTRPRRVSGWPRRTGPSARTDVAVCRAIGKALPPIGENGNVDCSARQSVGQRQARVPAVLAKMVEPSRAGGVAASKEIGELAIILFGGRTLVKQIG
jgi:hypothetical protein